CRSCAKDFITKTTIDKDSKMFDSDEIEVNGECATRTLTCSGPSSVIEINYDGGSIMDGNDGSVDQTSTVVATCNVAGTAWVVGGRDITQAECAAVPPCRTCAENLITVITTGTGGKPFTSDKIDTTSTTCATRTFVCNG
ncbi:hypothetical protein PFISCL1PPCAC_25886, partial [Pristionchus fissidentatus]